MTTNLVLLGTAGGPTPKVSRNAPAQAVVVDGHVYLIDAGNGVARRLAQAGYSANDLDAVLITHHHSDHNADVGTLLLLNWASDLRHRIDYYGPPPLAGMLDAYLDVNKADIETRVMDETRPPIERFFSATELITNGTVLEDERVRITTALVHHPPFDIALAYRVDTEDRSIVISGDTAPCPGLIALAEGADVLVHEVLHEPSLDRLTARATGVSLREHLVNSHTKVTDVGAIAEAAGVETLVLSHFVPSDDSVAEHEWVAAASRGYSGAVIGGRDLMVL